MDDSADPALLPGPGAEIQQQANLETGEAQPRVDLGEVGIHPSLFFQRPSEIPAPQRLIFSMGLPTRPGKAMHSFNQTTTQSMATWAA